MSLEPLGGILPAIGRSFAYSSNPAARLAFPSPGRLSFWPVVLILTVSLDNTPCAEMAVVDLAVVADLGHDRLGDGEVQTKSLLAPVTGQVMRGELRVARDADQALHR